MTEARAIREVPITAQHADGTARPLTWLIDRPHGMRVLLAHDSTTHRRGLLIDPQTLEVVDEMDQHEHNQGPHRVSFPELLELRGGLTYDQTLASLQRMGRADIWAEPSDADATLSRTVSVGSDGNAPAVAITFDSAEPRWLGQASIGEWDKAIRPDRFVRAASDDSGTLVIELAGVRLYVVPADDERDHWLHIVVIGPREDALHAMEARFPASEVSGLA